MNGILIAALGALSGCLIGLALTRRSKEKEKYYCDIVELCAHIINHISYKAEKLSEVIGSAGVCSAALRRNLEQYKTYLSGGELNISADILTKSECEQVKEFFSELGKYDGDTQIGEIKRRCHDFEQKYKRIKEKNDKQGNMYIKLGFLFGLLVGVLLL